MARQDRAKLSADIEELLKVYRISDRTLCKRAGVSHHTLADMRQGRRVMARSLLYLAQAAEQLRQEAGPAALEFEMWRQRGRKLADEVGNVSKLAARIGVSRHYLGRVLKGEKSMTDAVVARLRELDFQADIAAATDASWSISAD